jgi:hypothetical protein
MLRRYPAAIRLRQALPPAFVLSLLIFGVLAVWIPLVRWIIVIELASYALILFLAGIQMTLKNRDISLLCGVPLAIATMHFAWGSAFLWSVLAR